MQRSPWQCILQQGLDKAVVTTTAGEYLFALHNVNQPLAALVSVVWAVVYYGSAL